MTRKCKNKLCLAPLPKIKDCTTAHQRARVCNGECAFQAILQDRERKALKERKARDRQHRKEKKAFRERDKKHQTKLTQDVFNRFIRVLDQGQPCPSCGRSESEITERWAGGSWDCGHFITVGSQPALRFDPRNAFRQCKSCNGGEGKYGRFHGKSDTVRAQYEEGLIQRMGQAYVDWLKGPHEPAHYDCDTLIDIRRMFAAEIRFIEKHGRPSRDWRALPAEVRGVAAR